MPESDGSFVKATISGDAYQLYHGISLFGQGFGVLELYLCGKASL